MKVFVVAASNASGKDLKSVKIIDDRFYNEQWTADEQVKVLNRQYGQGVFSVYSADFTIGDVAPALKTR